MTPTQTEPTTPPDEPAPAAAGTSILDQLKAELAGLSDQERAQALAALSGGPTAESRPVTMLDTLREAGGWDAAGVLFAVDEIPGPHEIPLIVAKLVQLAGTGPTAPADASSQGPPASESDPDASPTAVSGGASSTPKRGAQS